LTCLQRIISLRASKRAGTAVEGEPGAPQARHVVGQQAVAARMRSDRENGTRVVRVRGGLNPWEQRELAPVFGLIAIVPVLVLLVACTDVANLLMARYALILVLYLLRLGL
jgi:hypothetical protein